MIRSLSIKNYRCLKQLHIGQVGHVNLVSGMNNVGKTALLEAIYLLVSRSLPDWPLKIEVARGFEDLINRTDVETVWGWLFYGKRAEDTIEVSYVDETDETHSLAITWDAWRETEVRFDQRPEAAGKQPGLLLLSYSSSLGKAETVSIHSKGLSRSNNLPKAVPVGVLLGRTTRKPEDDAKLFSELMAVGRHMQIVEALRILEPRLKQLSVLYLSGVPMVYGDIGLGQLVPLPQMGEGLTRILALALEIGRGRDGVILVDEIEHGLHHSVMTKVWQVIIQAARLNNTQVFATTHSWECIQAAYEAFSVAGPEDFRLHRLERIEGQIQAITYDQESLATSVEMNLEVR